jgi:hypothetical protein
MRSRLVPVLSLAVFCTVLVWLFVGNQGGWQAQAQKPDGQPPVMRKPYELRVVPHGKDLQFLSRVRFKPATGESWYSNQVVAGSGADKTEGWVKIGEEGAIPKGDYEVTLYTNGATRIDQASGTTWELDSRGGLKDLKWVKIPEPKGE